MNTNNDLFNLHLSKSIGSVDEENSDFYSKFPYPWSPRTFSLYPESIAWNFLHQDIGVYDASRLPKNMKIWVAGCGTNQAVYTALKFPECEVVGSDISPESLKIAKKNADALGIKNLKLEQKSINQAPYTDHFDYIICTGVIHHNADPAFTLAQLKSALKRDGIMELMVYNYYHRLLTTAFQKAVRNFRSTALKEIDYDTEAEIAQKLIESFKGSDVMENFLGHYHDVPLAKMADNLIQPVEHSYTVETFDGMVQSCGIEILQPCLNKFDMDGKRYTWNLKLSNPILYKYYSSLEDKVRWQISNLLLVDSSPMVWFYCQRTDSSFKRQTEAEICQSFLKTRFKKVGEQLKVFLLDESEIYQPQDHMLKFPIRQPVTDGLIKLLDNINEQETIEEIFIRCGIEKTFTNINNARILLSTTENPFLLSNKV